MHGVTIEKARYKTATRRRQELLLHTDELHITFHVDLGYVDG